MSTRMLWTSALTALVLSCGGRERPPENPSQGPASGGQGSDVVPALPSPSPPPGTEPVPGPGGPDTLPDGSTQPEGAPPGPLSWRELRSPLIALGPVSPAALPRGFDAQVTGGTSGGGRPPISTGGTPSTGGGIGIGGAGGVAAR